MRANCIGALIGRKLVKRAARARKASLPGPASRAACTTFGRFNAKSNWAPVKALITTISRDFPVVLRCKAAANLRLPSSLASAAWINARMSSRPTAASTLEKPLTTVPALPAIASASSTARSINLSVCSARSWATRTSRLKPRAKTLRFAASSIAVRVAVTQMPRPGNFRLRRVLPRHRDPPTNGSFPAAGFSSG